MKDYIPVITHNDHKFNLRTHRYRMISLSVNGCAHELYKFLFFGGTTGISCKNKIRKENFQMCLSLSFNNYKIGFKIRITSPLQT